MLDSEAIENIQRIKDTAYFIWGDKCRFGEVEVVEAPFSMFNLSMRLYGLYDIRLEYDRSILDISVKQYGKYVWLTDLTNEHIVEGFESCKQNNLIQNFKVLDRVLK